MKWVDNSITWVKEDNLPRQVLTKLKKVGKINYDREEENSLGTPKSVIVQCTDIDTIHTDQTNQPLREQ